MKALIRGLIRVKIKARTRGGRKGGGLIYSEFATEKVISMGQSNIRMGASQIFVWASQIFIWARVKYSYGRESNIRMGASQKYVPGGLRQKKWQPWVNTWVRADAVEDSENPTYVYRVHGDMGTRG